MLMRRGSREAAAHGHCALCASSRVVAPHALARHEALFRAPRNCDFGCGVLLNDLAQLREYAQAACMRRQIVCRFCRLAVAAGPPAASADDRRTSARVLELCMDAEAAYLFARERQKRHDEE